MRTEEPKHTREQNAKRRMAAYRKRMRAQGLRAVQMWIYDTRSDAVCEDIQRQARLLAKIPDAPEDVAWMESGDTDGWEA